MKWLFRSERASRYGSAERRPLARSTDLLALCSFVLVAVGVLVLWNPPSPPLRALVGLPLLFVAPGYALVSALFPHAAGERATGVAGSADDAVGVTDTERLALSFGSSLAVLPLISLPLASVAGFTSASVVAAVGGFALLVAALAWIRRRRLPPNRRYHPALAGRLAGLRSALFPRGSPLLAATNLALAASVVLALMTGGYALIAPQDGERYTEMQLLSEDESGELVAAGYPAEIESGESVSLTVAVENREGADRSYELVVLQERYADGERLDREPVHRAAIDAADGETVHSEQTVSPTAEDGRIRLVYLLYADGVPDDPTPENAYRYTHLWIDVAGDSLDLDPGDLPLPDDEGDSVDESDNESGSGDDGTGSDDGDPGDGDGSDDGGDSSDGDDGSDDGSGDGDGSDDGDGGSGDGSGGDDGGSDGGGSGDGSGGDDGGSDGDDDSEDGFPFG